MQSAAGAPAGARQDRPGDAIAAWAPVRSSVLALQISRPAGLDPVGDLEPVHAPEVLRVIGDERARIPLEAWRGHRPLEGVRRARDGPEGCPTPGAGFSSLLKSKLIITSGERNQPEAANEESPMHPHLSGPC